MKKTTTRSLLFAFLLLASIGSYAYLNVASYAQDAEAEEKESLIEREDASLVLPDVMFIKKVVETGKRLLPAS